MQLPQLTGRMALPLPFALPQVKDEWPVLISITVAFSISISITIGVPSAISIIISIKPAQVKG